MLLLGSINAFCQSEYLDNCEIPYNKEGKYVTLQPMTGLVFDKDYKIFSYCSDPKVTPPKHFVSVDLSTTKLDFRIYDAAGKLLKTTYLTHVSFKKDILNSKKLERDPSGNKWSQKNVFILKTSDSRVGGDVTIERNLGNKGSITIHYYFLNSKGEKTAEYNISLDL